MNFFLRYLLPAYLLIYFVSAFCWRSYMVWKRTGINPYKLGKADNAHNFVGRLFRLALVAITLVIILHSISNEAYHYLTPIRWLEHPLLVLIGLGLLLVSLVWTLLAQAQMGNSWRIGIDADNKTQLVTHGVFGISRNPIFLGMRLTLLGFFLILPNAVTLTTFVLGNALMQIQVRLEEEYLSRIHGEDYRRYRQQTRRWL